MSDGATTLERSRGPFRKLVADAGLLEAHVAVLAKPLTPEEAIGTPGRRDFPIIVGKERVLEASVCGAKGHAFTDSAREFLGTLADVVNLELTTNQNRAVYIATLNAVLRHLGIVSATLHCKDDDPEKCARQIADHLLKKYSRATVGLIGFNPAIAQRLADTFAPDHLRISDLHDANVGQRKFGVEIWDGRERTDELIDAVDVVLLTGTTLVNGTFDRIWNRIQAQGKGGLIYGVTAAGVSKLMGIERICPYARES